MEGFSDGSREGSWGVKFLVIGLLFWLLDHKWNNSVTDPERVSRGVAGTPFEISLFHFHL